MGISTRRGAAALLAAGAMVLAPLSATADDSTIIDVDGPAEITVPGGPNIYRFANYDRVTTAIEAMQRTNGVWGDTAIIATTATYQDALAATPLADVLDAPILLNAPGDTLDPRVAAALHGEEISKIIILGGSDVFSEAFVDSVEANGFTFDARVNGVNRYQTAVALAREAIYRDEEGVLNNANIFLADGTDFADALAAGAAAANHSGVVLLTKGSTGLDSATYNAITGENGGWNDWWLENHSSMIAVGGPARAAAAIGHQEDPLEIHDAVVGADRYETAVMLAAKYVPFAETYTIASGEKFPDAVVAGAFAGNVDGPLLLTQETNLPRVVEAYLSAPERRETVDAVVVFGGTNSVAPSVSREVANLPWDN